MSGFTCCLSYDGPRLSVQDKEQLLSIARAMTKEQLAKWRFRGNGVHGEMRTDYRVKHLGFVTGVEFFAEVTHDGGDTTVKFLATAAELDGPVDGIWDAVDALMLQ